MRHILTRHLETIEWLAFFGLILMAWGLLFAMQPENDWASLYGADFWAALCAPLTAQSGYDAIFAMWALMSAAMMAPTFVPTLMTFQDLTHTDAANATSRAALLAGYITIWIGFSAVAAMAQLGLARFDLIAGSGASTSYWLSAGLLAGAGLYQFSALKESCLSKCRAPLTFFLGNWRDGWTGAASMGLQLGLVCLGCCWALMTLGFVGGVMNTVWMGIATVLMVLEKLPQIGRYVTKPLGVALLAGAVFAALAATGI